MFSPLTKRPKQSSRTPLHRAAPLDSPVTPASHNRESANRDSFISDRPATGTPAPWAPRLSVLARYPDPSLSLSKFATVSPDLVLITLSIVVVVRRVSPVNDANQLKPVFVGEFPQLVRDEQMRNNTHPG